MRCYPTNSLYLIFIEVRADEQNKISLGREGA